MRVLVVEDFEVLAEAIGKGLRREGMAVDIVLDGARAVHQLAITRYDVVVLDRDLPLVHGDEICRRLAAEGDTTRILMLTAAGSVRDRVEGLDLGADDYLPKPFDFAELIAAVRALGRRSTAPLPPTLEAADITLDPSRRVASRAGRRLELSPKEFAVLEYLLAAPDKVVSAEELLERVWDEAADPFTSTVKTTIKRLRGKLGDPPVIETVREGGYRIGGNVVTASRLLARAARLPRRTLQVQLTLLYSGAFIALVVLVLAAANLLIIRSSTGAPGTPFVLSQGPAPHDLAVLSGIILVVSMLVALVLGWLIAGRLLARLRTITATAQDISAGDLHRRLELGGPEDEFQELGKTLDDLFGRLESAFEAQRHFVANVSHEFRTPLTAERALLQVALADSDASAEALRTVCEQVLQLSTQQEHLIDTLLTLATSERGVEHWEPVDLADLVESCVASRRHDADRRRIVVELALGPAPVLGDPALIESLVVNLIDNAIRHNVGGGRVEAETTVASDGRPALSVRNTGVIVAAGEIDHLFQPFRQLGRERVHYGDGHGLGLSIVRAIAAAHGAAISAETREDGGLNVSVVFRRTST